MSVHTTNGFKTGEINTPLPDKGKNIWYYNGMDAFGFIHYL